jgi:hypothetical protein
MVPKKERVCEDFLIFLPSHDQADPPRLRQLEKAERGFRTFMTQ